MKKLLKISQSKPLMFGLVLAASTALVLSVGAGKALAFSGSGDGSSGSPYQITTCSQLSEVNDNSTADYVLANNIDCSSTPFGNTVIPGFSGSFNGANHVISGLIINAPSNDSVGLFGLLSSSATVSNLTIFASINGHDDVGILAANTLNNPQISRVGTYGVVTCDGGCGGLIGNLDAGAISLSYSTASITANSGYVGGLVASMNGTTINDSYYNGTIVDSGSNPLVGGIVGDMTGGQITNGYAAGSITANSSGASIGGIMGGGTFDPGIFSTFAAITITGGSSINNGGICSQAYTIAHGGGNFYDSNLTGINGSPSDPDCSATPTNISSYFKGSSTNHPMDDWQFDITHWRVVDGGYPVLEPLFDPVMFCEEPQSTDTTITGACSYIPSGWGTPTWEARWSVHDANNWHPITLDDIHTAAATVTGLTPGTEYDLEFRFTNDFGTGPWAKNVILTTGTAPSTPTTTNKKLTVKQTHGTTNLITDSSHSSQDSNKTPDSTNSPLTTSAPLEPTTIASTIEPNIVNNHNYKKFYIVGVLVALVAAIELIKYVAKLGGDS